MKAIGYNILINKEKEGIKATKGGLLLSESQRQDIRYVKATVVSAGEEVVGIKKDDNIFFDRHAGHKVEFEKLLYHVIKAQDVVIVT